MTAARVKCPRCHRRNPKEATYCFFDGVALRNGQRDKQGAALGQEFIFPSGRRCKTFDELARACVAEWDSARELLRQGSLRQYFIGLGRNDLAGAARQAAEQSDIDEGLDSFLRELPVAEIPGPKLDLLPRRLNLGKLSAGDQRTYTLTIFNQGSRLLLGTVQVEGASWINFSVGHCSNLDGQAHGQERSLAPRANGSSEAGIKTSKQQQIQLFIDTRGIPAGQPYAAKLTIITNGGAVEVPVRMELLPVPFPKAALYGPENPRDLAVLMKERPKDAAPLIESGIVREWFEDNGWNYPVSTPTADGIACVQQFFEAMGLSRPPALRISMEADWINCKGGRRVRGNVKLETKAGKWVYGHVTSDSPWLKVLTPQIAGPRRAVVEYEVDPRGVQNPHPAEGHLTITGNGNQKFRVTIHADLRPAKLWMGRNALSALLAGAAVAMTLRFLLVLTDAIIRGPDSAGTLLPASPGDYLFRFSLLTFWILPTLSLVWAFKNCAPKDFPPVLVVATITGWAVSFTFIGVAFAVDLAMSTLVPFNIPGVPVAGWTALGAISGLVSRMVWPRWTDRMVAMLLAMFGAIRASTG